MKFSESLRSFIALHLLRAPIGLSNRAESLPTKWSSPRREEAATIRANMAVETGMKETETVPVVEERTVDSTSSTTPLYSLHTQHQLVDPMITTSFRGILLAQTKDQAKARSH